MTDSVLPNPQGPLVVQPLAPGGIYFSLVVPTYNEGANMRPLVEQVTAVLNANYQGRYEIIVVDDNSADGTGDAVIALARRIPSSN